MQADLCTSMFYRTHPALSRQLGHVSEVCMATAPKTPLVGGLEACLQIYIKKPACLAQSVERKAINPVSEGSSSTEGVRVQLVTHP